MLLSVIIPVHNTEKYIEKCVESIIDQKLDKSSYEIIIIENASTDKSKDVCSQLCEKYSEFQISVISIEIANVGYARNIGIEHAKGKYIHFIDSDDWIGNGMYSKMKEQLQLEPSVIVTGIINDYEVTNTQRIESSEAYEYLKEKSDMQSFFNRMDSRMKVWMLNMIWNKWYDRQIIVENNIKFRTDINLGEDFVFNCEYFAIIQNCIILNDSFYHYMRREQETLVSRFRCDGMYRKPIIYDAYCKLYSSHGILEGNQKKIDEDEGKSYFATLYQVLKKQCPWNHRQKIEYIKSICESKHFWVATFFLQKQNSIYYKLLNELIKKKAYNNLYFIIALRMLVKRWR